MHTGLYVPEMCESLDGFRGTIRSEMLPPQRGNDYLPEHSAVVQMGTDEPDASVSNVVHKLKSPLSAIIMTSNAIFNITDLTPEEFYEYLHQIRSNAYEMDQIINSILLRSAGCRADAP